VWEQDLGLTWLFRLRGPVEAPKDVLVVSIDRESSKRLGLPNIPRKWPRDLYARLLDRLADAGASVVAFDLIFREPRDSIQDSAFAAAVRRAGNVILLEYLKKETLQVHLGGQVGSSELVIEQRIQPISILADAASGLAPFALPRVPVKVSQAWVFKPEAGDAPVLPLVALQVHAAAALDDLMALIEIVDPSAYESLTSTLRQSDRGLRTHNRARMLRQLFRDRPALRSGLEAHLDDLDTGDASRREKLMALISAYGGPDSIYLNYYGPPRSIETVAFFRLLDDGPLDGLELSGRAVFVGMAESAQPEQLDGFYTPFTAESGLDIGGVEIAATAFANLLTRGYISPLHPSLELALIAAWGLLLGGLLRWAPGGWIPLAAILSGGLYFMLALVLFSRANVWLPMVTPLLVQLLAGTLGALLLRYRDVRDERENIRRAFGMHLPLQVVDELARGIDDFSASSEEAFGVCLASDAEQFTGLAEGLAPTALHRIMNDYYDALFTPVRAGGGVVADVVGDSMLAIWAAPENRRDLRRRACETALEILHVVDKFNERNPAYRLPTRLGIHCGELVLGHIGAVDHYEYRPVGDIVNAATRIEGLSKQLGTRLLVSADVVEGINGFRKRELGRFVLKGKIQPIAVFELTDLPRRNDMSIDRLYASFAEGLGAFRTGAWGEALRCFEAIEREQGHDGPSAFYCAICRDYVAKPPEHEWTGIVTLATK
jgi:adenylate cyclase